MLLWLLVHLSAGAETYEVGSDRQDPVLDLSEPDSLFVVTLTDPKLDLSAFTVKFPEGDVPLDALHDELVAAKFAVGDTMELWWTEKEGPQMRLPPVGPLGGVCEPVFIVRCTVLYGSVWCVWEYLGDACCERSPCP